MEQFHHGIKNTAEIGDSIRWIFKSLLLILSGPGFFLPFNELTTEATSSNEASYLFAGRTVKFEPWQKCDGSASRDLEVRGSLSIVSRANRRGLFLSAAKSTALLKGVCNFVLRSDFKQLASRNKCPNKYDISIKTLEPKSKLIECNH